MVDISIENLKEACAHLAGVVGVYQVTLHGDAPLDLLRWLIAQPGAEVSEYERSDSGRQADVHATILGVEVCAWSSDRDAGYELLLAAKLADDAAHAVQAAKEQAA